MIGPAASSKRPACKSEVPREALRSADRDRLAAKRAALRLFSIAKDKFGGLKDCPCLGRANQPLLKTQ